MGIFVWCQFRSHQYGLLAPLFSAAKCLSALAINEGRCDCLVGWLRCITWFWAMVSGLMQRPHDRSCVLIVWVQVFRHRGDCIFPADLASSFVEIKDSCFRIWSLVLKSSPSHRPLCTKLDLTSFYRPGNSNRSLFAPVFGNKNYICFRCLPLFTTSFPSSVQI